MGKGGGARLQKFTLLLHTPTKVADLLGGENRVGHVAQMVRFGREKMRQKPKQCRGSDLNNFGMRPNLIFLTDHLNIPSVIVLCV